MRTQFIEAYMRVCAGAGGGRRAASAGVRARQLPPRMHRQVACTEGLLPHLPERNQVACVTQAGRRVAVVWHACGDQRPA